MFGAALLLYVISGNVLAGTQNGEKIPFDIPRQRADLALIAFAEQADRTLLFSYDAARARTANRLVGQYEMAEALELLLAGTGLSVSIGRDGQLRVIEIPALNEERTVKKRKSMLGQLVAGIGLVSSAGFSQAQPDHDSQAQATTSRGLEEVVVTARKISESIQDVPVAIQAFTGTSLAERGLTNIAEIGNSVSNMEFDSLSPISGSSNTPNINIRGIGTTDFLLTIDPSVGVYVDGVYVARSVGGLFDLLDIEQVEVLKGPQGTLFGRNTTAGAVLLTTRKPGDETRLGFEVVTGTDSRVDVRARASGHLSESLSASLALSIKRQNGYGKRRDFFADNAGLGTLAADIAGITVYDESTGALLTGNTTGLAPGSLIAGGITAQPPLDKRPGNTNTDSARLSLHWRASESVSAAVAIDYVDTAEAAPALVLLDIFYADPTAGGAPNVAGLHGLFGFDALTVPYDERFIIGDNFSTMRPDPDSTIPKRSACR